MLLIHSVLQATMEGLWAMKAMEHAEIYFNLLCAVDPKMLKLTPKDDLIYQEFRKEFPDFNIEKLNEEDLKSPSAKEAITDINNLMQSSAIRNVKDLRKSVD
ncbi:Protein PBDC1 [Portunus trituberculatus]|uniref:Protein PBDC1 n=1 Tax=Portunus trituberculatus TaxID=210409 RepID=A0A5B7EVE0_PORTR|nr:Protein PBDC1 [Portunus trituberculatus]